MHQDQICIEDKSRIDPKQLSSSRDHNSQIHFDGQDAIQSIYSYSLLFRSLKTGPIEFSQSLEKTLSQLQVQYQRSVELMKLSLKVNYEQCERKIRDIYELNNKEFSFDMFEPHLKRGTFKIQFYLGIVNWKKAHPSEDIQNYIQNMPKNCIIDYTKTINNLMASLISKKPAFGKNIYQKGDEHQITEQLEQLNKPMEARFDDNLKFDQKLSLSKQPLKKKRECKRKNKEILMQLAEIFCNSQSQLKYKDIQQPLRKKLHLYQGRSRQRKFSSYMENIMNKICLNIEHIIEKDLGFRRMNHSHRVNRVSIWIDLRSYMNWMNKEEADIFIRCVRFFMNLNQDIEISPYEIYVMHVLIMIKVIQKMRVKNIQFTQNASPKDLKKEITYLYLHYDSFSKVKEMLAVRYPYEKKLTDEYLMETFKEIIINTYNRLKERELIENARFQELIHLETDFDGQLWIPVVRKYIEYQIFDKVDSSEKMWLETIMKNIINKQQDKEQIYVTKNQHVIEDTIDKFKDQPLVINCKEENNPLTTEFHVRTKEERISQFFHFPKIVKIEQISDSGSLQEFDQESKQE